jgi:hypothetical protein
MQTITINSKTSVNTNTRTATAATRSLFPKEARFEANRFGIVAALVLVQVSIAGFNVVVPAMAGASIWAMAPGIFMAFMSNSLAFAQMKMKWVLSAFAISMLVNAFISVYYLVQLAAA